MPCLDADGAPTAVAARLLEALADGRPRTVQEVAAVAELPLYRVRSGLRELAEAALVAPDGDAFRLAERGRSLLAS